MPANIASSVLSVDPVAQVDGRIWVTETHTDTAGGVHIFQYLGEPGATDMDQVMAARAIDLSVQLTAGEAMANVAAVLDNGRAALLSAQFSTAADVMPLFAGMMTGLTPPQWLMLGDYLAGSTAEQLEAFFGLTADQITAIQALPSVQSQVAAIAGVASAVVN